MNDVKQVIVVRKDLNMRKSELSAQTAHASMMFLIDNNEADRNDEVVIKLTPAEATWLSGSFAPIILTVDSQDALEDLIFQAKMSDVEVHTSVDEQETLTCAAFGPCDSEDIDRITGNLKNM